MASAETDAEVSVIGGNVLHRFGEAGDILWRERQAKNTSRKADQAGPIKIVAKAQLRRHFKPEVVIPEDTIYTDAYGIGNRQRSMARLR